MKSTVGKSGALIRLGKVRFAEFWTGEHLDQGAFGPGSIWTREHLDWRAFGFGEHLDGEHLMGSIWQGAFGIPRDTQEYPEISRDICYN